MKIIFVAFIFITVAAHTEAKKRCFPIPSCGQHEVQSKCGANECQATCANPNLANVCQAECKAGCVCEANYLRTPEGKCVLSEECPQMCKFKWLSKAVLSKTLCAATHRLDNTVKCADNEVYERCSTACGDPTCGNRDGFFCGGGCNPKCVCKAGYVRDGDNKCIDVNSCPASDVLPQPANGPIYGNSNSISS